MEPTKIQNEIINNEGNTVVLASPGSGKTFILSEIIKRYLKKKELLRYQGIIALSYTRKASSHLKSRTLESGISPKNSYFGTIDSFCLTQIIVLFGPFIFGTPTKEIEVISISELKDAEKQILHTCFEEHPDYENIDTVIWNHLNVLFQKGFVVLETIEMLTLFIERHSKACRKYISARFKAIFVDEFQDADTYTNQLFLDMVSIGLIGIAVGDINQSIYGFAHKKKTFLKELVQNPLFKYFFLSENFRCSLPIINYSNRIIDKKHQLYETDESGVYLINLKGNEENISYFIDRNIIRICKKWDVSDFSEIAILVRNSRTQNLINKSLKTPHRIVTTTELDMDINPRSRLYTNLLRLYWDNKMSFINAIEEFVDYESLEKSKQNDLHKLSKFIRMVNYKDRLDLLDFFIPMANILFPKVGIGKSTRLLKMTLNDEQMFLSYQPFSSKEILIMTLHKSILR